MGDKKSVIIFRVRDQDFAYETDSVAETVRVDRVFPVPLAPEYLRGVMNLRNNVIPVVDLRSLLWGETSDRDTAVIVEEEGKTVGLLVDAVLGITEVAPGDIKRVRKKEVEGIRREFIRGMFKREGRVVFLLDLRTITGKSRAHRRSGTKRVGGGDTGEASATGKDLRGFVVFPAGREWFALPVEEVREIIDFPSSLSKVPGAPRYVEGIFLLRGEEIPLLSFCGAVGLEDCGEERRAIVVNAGKTVLALGVEDVKEIRWVEEGSILRTEEGSKGVLALENGRRLVLVMSLRDVVNPEDIEDLSGGTAEGKEEPLEVENMRSFVSFTVGNVEMAIAIEKVKEVIEVSSLTPMPGSPHHIDGVYNLRNSVIAISSLPKRLGLKAEESDKVIVLEGLPVGFRVTKLKGILRVREQDIQPADQIADVEERILEGIIRTEEGKVIFILDPERVLKEEDIKFLEEGVIKDGGER
jgi:purine-binding chemotaxis protein CheW